MDVGVAVGDEAFHAIEQPGAVGLLGCLEHHTLEVGAGVGLGEVHRHGLTGAYARDEALALVVGAEFIECLGAVLKAPEVLEACIGTAYDVGGHDVGGDGEVEASVAARQASRFC